MQKKKPKHKKRPRRQPLRNIDHLTPEEQVYELKQSRKATKSSAPPNTSTPIITFPITSHVPFASGLATS